MQRRLLRLLIVTTALSGLPQMAQAADSSPQVVPDSSDLLNLSLQQLSDVEVTSVSKKAEKASQAAAAVYVITQEDIRRSGMQSVPELLRMVPGLQVAQMGSNNWAITSRGGNGQFANKLLVMIDGRTVYTPVFSGVFWDVQNMILEDIERIEVIRGPGATLWGANAVNGVINIITKSAKDTQGKLVTASVGNQDRVSTGARYGGTEGNLAYRTYVQYFNENQQHNAANPTLGITQGSGAGDQWDNAQGGFRLDWGTGKEQQTLQSDVYQGVENSQRFLPTTTPGPNTITSLPIAAFGGTASFNPVNDTDHVSGMNILGRATHEISAGSDVTLQAYYDDVNREYDFVGSSLHTQTFDADFQHNLAVGSRNDVTWGLGYRFINSTFGNSYLISYSPENYYESVYSGFLQDKITLIEDKLFFTLGSKLEHNDFSGFEWEPSARIAWTPTSTQTVWAAVSRAVRTPNQSDENQALVGYATPGFVSAAQGQDSSSANVVTTYELGYRVQPRENISLDIASFVNEYRRLDSSTLGNPYLDGAGNEIFPTINTTDSRGESQGIEMAATWEATHYLKLSAGYTLYYSAESVAGVPGVVTALNGPNQQFNLRSYLDLPHNVQWDTMLYTVEALPYVTDQYGNVGIPGYARLDSRLGWSPIPGLDLSLIGQNLLQAEHLEYSPALYQTPEEIGRSVIAKATFRF